MHYTVCSLQGNAVYCLTLTTQVHSLLLTIDYQNKNAFISLSHCYKNETFFFCSPHEPAANYTQGCRETLEPRAATPASQAAS